MSLRPKSLFFYALNKCLLQGTLYFVCSALNSVSSSTLGSVNSTLSGVLSGIGSTLNSVSGTLSSILSSVNGTLSGVLSSVSSTLNSISSSTGYIGNLNSRKIVHSVNQRGDGTSTNNSLDLVSIFLQEGLNGLQISLGFCYVGAFQSLNLLLDSGKKISQLSAVTSLDNLGDGVGSDLNYFWSLGLIGWSRSSGLVLTSGECHGNCGHCKQKEFFHFSNWFSKTYVN